jgi:hypothetical protein
MLQFCFVLGVYLKTRVILRHAAVATVFKAIHSLSLILSNLGGDRSPSHFLSSECPDQRK